jgi:phosphinothricin acetyltransferase
VEANSPSTFAKTEGGPAMSPQIRLASEDDADQVRAIYAPFCADDSPVSFEVVPPSVEEMKGRIARTLDHFPWLVCEAAEEILGYVYAGPHSERAAYRWSVNTAIYIRPGRRRSGVGRALYASLFAVLRLQGYVNAYAGSTLPNPGSVGLHTAMGFEPVGVYRGVGYKAGAWHDVAWWQLALE